MAEWEEVLRRRVQAHEERKREYVRWIATGLTATSVLVGIVIQSIGTVRLGSHFYVSLSILFVGSYLTAQFVWEMAREKITQAVGQIAGAPRFARPWDLVPTPADVAKTPLLKHVWELGSSLAITVVVALEAWVIQTPASGVLSQLAEVRIATLALSGGLLFLGYRSSKKPLPTGGARRVGLFFVGKALVSAYYGLQLWLIGEAFLAVSIVVLQVPALILIVLEGAGIISVGRVIWRVAWPLVSYNANAMGIYSRICDGILSGQYPNPDAVSVEVKRILGGK